MYKAYCTGHPNSWLTVSTADPDILYQTFTGSLVSGDAVLLARASTMDTSVLMNGAGGSFVGAYIVGGDVYAAYQKLGADINAQIAFFGIPTGHEEIGEDGISVTQDFEKGSISVDANGTATVQSDRVDGVKALIQALPEVEDITLEDEDAAAAARAAYADLPANAFIQGLVDNIDRLEAAEAQLKKLKDDGLAVQGVIDLIEKIPAIDALTLEDASLVEDARKAYDLLTAAQAEQVGETYLAVLTAAEKAMDLLQEEAAAAEVVSLIQNGQWAEARRAYDALPESARALVQNYDVLLDYEQSLEVQPTGDINNDGNIDITDIMRIRQYMLKKDTPAYVEISRVNFNGNGEIDREDVEEIRRILFGNAAAAPASTDVQIQVLGREAVKAEGINSLTYGPYVFGDKIAITSDYAYFWVQLCEELPETLVYSESGTFYFEIPSADTGYAPGTFSAESNTITARVATDDEVAASRNLAVNPYDFKYGDEKTTYNAALDTLPADSAAVAQGQIHSFPHAYANRVTENKPVFNAHNAIDGMKQTGNQGHNSYPWQSWGGGQYDDVEFVIYFGRPVTVDHLVFTLRADFSTGSGREHDSYWTSGTIEFSDGTQVKTTFVKPDGQQDQVVQLDTPVTTTSVRLKNLVRHEDPSLTDGWTALTELEVYGAETVTANPRASKDYTEPYFGGKEAVVTTDELSASDIEEQMKLTFDYFRARNNISDLKWTSAVYYSGIMDAYMTTGDLDYYLFAHNRAESVDYRMNSASFTDHGDDYSISQLYLTLNGLLPSDKKTAKLLANADYNVKTNGFIRYDWCDALFMSGSIYTKLANLTGDDEYSRVEHESYLRWRNGEGPAMSDGREPVALYNTDYNLWYRDSKYVNGGHRPSMPAPSSGKDIFWARGNGWVFAYYAQQMLYIQDTESEMYQTLKKDFQDMAAALKKYQREDGTWNPSLIDPTYYGGPETTGTCGFLYGYAIGIQLGILDAEEYLPVAIKAYNALTGFCQEEPGRIGYMQPEGEDPCNYNENTCRDSMNQFGTGLFLMASAALMRMCEDYEAPGLQVPIDSQESFTNVPEGAYPVKDNAKAYTVSSGDVNGPGPAMWDHTTYDGTPGTRWSATGASQWNQVELNQPVVFNRAVVVAYEQRDYKYKIEVSDTGDFDRWYTVVDRTKEPYDSAPYIEDSFEPVMAKFIRITLSGAWTYDRNMTNICAVLLYEDTSGEAYTDLADVFGEPSGSPYPVTENAVEYKVSSVDANGSAAAEESTGGEDGEDDFTLSAASLPVDNPKSGEAGAAVLAAGVLLAAAAVITVLKLKKA